MDTHPVSLLIALLVALHGYRKGSLSTSGAIAAGLLGYFSLGNTIRVFGVALLVHYFAGSRATKVKASIKASLEESHTTSSDPKHLTGGNRDAIQVLCNGYIGLLASVNWRILFSGEATSQWKSWKSDEWCAVDGRQDEGISRFLIMMALGFFATCCGDTLASELGILARGRPRLITTLQEVPPGVNGGVSPLGLLMSWLGGVLIGATVSITLMIENPACRTVSSLMEMPVWLELVVIGGMAGLMGSVLDSILGATLQESLYSVTRKKVVHSKTPKDKDEEIVVISGEDILSNNQVNFVSATCMALFTALACKVYG